jgi:hypothetical protein
MKAALFAVGCMPLLGDAPTTQESIIGFIFGCTPPTIYFLDTDPRPGTEPFTIAAITINVKDQLNLLSTPLIIHQTPTLQQVFLLPLTEICNAL